MHTPTHSLTLTLPHTHTLTLTHTLSFHTLDGHRMAGSTPLGLLIQSEFDLKLNNINFRVEPSADGMCIHMYMYAYTVEPPIVDTPKSGQPPYNGQTVCPLPTTACMLEPPKKGQPPNNGQNTRPQRVHCSEVPLYTSTVLLYIAVQAPSDNLAVFEELKGEVSIPQTQCQPAPGQLYNITYCTYIRILGICTGIADACAYN